MSMNSSGDVKNNDALIEVFLKSCSGNGIKSSRCIEYEAVLKGQSSSAATPMVVKSKGKDKIKGQI